MSIGRILLRIACAPFFLRCLVTGALIGILSLFFRADWVFMIVLCVGIPAIWGGSGRFDGSSGGGGSAHSGHGCGDGGGHGH